MGLEWLVQSIERGMALDAKYFTLDIEPSKRGEGAWDKSLSSKPQSRFAGQTYVSIPPEFDNGNKRRRIRRTQSSVVQEGIWDGILSGVSNKQRVDRHETGDRSAEVTFEIPNEESPLIAGFADDYADVTRGLFEGMRFYTWGFTPAKVCLVSRYPNSTRKKC